MWSVLVASQLLLGVSAGANQCDKARTTVEMEQCLRQELAGEERGLAAAEKKVRDQLPDSARAPFDSAAAVWRTYRERECRAVYRANSSGTIAASSLVGCQIELTKTRRSLVIRIYGVEE
jgi:uncharacterized protein YecT (DUF1311 family)